MAKKVPAFNQKPGNRQPPAKRHVYQPWRAHAGIGPTTRGSKPDKQPATINNHSAQFLEHSALLPPTGGFLLGERYALCERMGQ